MIPSHRMIGVLGLAMLSGGLARVIDERQSVDEPKSPEPEPVVETKKSRQVLRAEARAMAKRSRK